MTTTDLIKPMNGEIVTGDRAAMIQQEMTAEDERNAFAFMPTRIIMPTGGANFFTLSDGDALQPFRAQQGHVDGGGGDHQPLVGADI